MAFMKISLLYVVLVSTLHAYAGPIPGPNQSGSSRNDDLVMTYHFHRHYPNATIPHLRHAATGFHRRPESTTSEQTTTAAATSTSIAASQSAAASATAASSSLNPSATDCFLTLPDDPLSAEGLSTPWTLGAPCSQAVSLQQAFAEASVFDPSTNTLSVYHPLVINDGMTPQAAPVVPDLPEGAIVGLWFGFNGGVLQLLDKEGRNTNESPTLQSIDCVNGLPGVNGDVFGQVSWCNTQPFWAAVNESFAAGKIDVPELGNDHNGRPCPTSRSFEIVDACPSDNVPTQYLLLSDGSTVQDNTANRDKFPNAEVINNASDESLIANILDPAIGCTPFLSNNLDDPGTTFTSLALNELLAKARQSAPIALVPLNDPDTLLTSDGQVSPAKTNAYRLGVNQPFLTASGPDDGALDFYCNGMIEIAPRFFLDNQDTFTGMTSPATSVGNNLFTFMCNRYLESLTMLGCPENSTQPVACTLDSSGAATSCTINSSVKDS